MIRMFLLLKNCIENYRTDITDIKSFPDGLIKPEPHILIEIFMSYGPRICFIFGRYWKDLHGLFDIIEKILITQC